MAAAEEAPKKVASRNALTWTARRQPRNASRARTFAATTRTHLVNEHVKHVGAVVQRQLVRGDLRVLGVGALLFFLPLRRRAPRRTAPARRATRRARTDAQPGLLSTLFTLLTKSYVWARGERERGERAARARGSHGEPWRAQLRAERPPHARPRAAPTACGPHTLSVVCVREASTTLSVLRATHRNLISRTAAILSR